MNNQEKNTYVRNQILTTLLEMMKTESFNSITISDLVAKADVGRASFAQITEQKSVLHEEAERLKKELKTIRKNDNPYDVRLILIRTLDFYKLHTDFYITLYNSGLKQMIQDSIVDESLISDNQPAPLAYTASAFSYLIYGWIIEWIRRGMKETSDELIAMFENS